MARRRKSERERYFSDRPRPLRNFGHSKRQPQSHEIAVDRHARLETKDRGQMTRRAAYLARNSLQRPVGTRFCSQQLAGIADPTSAASPCKRTASLPRRKTRPQIQDTLHQRQCELFQLQRYGRWTCDGIAQLSMQPQSRARNEHTAIVIRRSLLHEPHGRDENRAFIPERRWMTDAIGISTIEEHRVVGIRKKATPAKLQTKQPAANQDELSGG